MEGARRALPAAALLAALVLAVGPRPATADVGDISVGGVWVCRITQPAEGLSREARAAQINRQITEALSTPRFRRGAVVYVRPDGPNTRILVDKLLIMTVTPADVQGTSVTTAQLARQWAQRLAVGLSKALPDAEFHTF
jgi:hypothetical protein